MKPIIKKWKSKSNGLGYQQLKDITQQHWYKEDEYYCVCCDFSYPKFLDVQHGLQPREKVVCPGCGSLERHRMLMHYLHAHTDTFFPEGCRILYIAPMPGIKSYLQAVPNATYLGADLDSALADVHFDLTAIPYPDASFDFCICSHTLSYIQDDQKAISELYRVLSHGANLLVMESIQDTHETHESDTHDTAIQHTYGKDFAQYLTTFGFEVEEVPYAERLDKKIQEREVLNPNEIIFHCKK